jgi:hypothetical protein
MPTKTRKPKRGRPALPPEELRDARLLVKLKPSELAQLKVEAGEVGLPLSLYARLVLIRRPIPDAR